jgi:Tol biopolymer transport system component
VGFHVTRSGAIRDFYIVPSDGGRRTRIEVPSENNLAIRFSPDGQSVLYIDQGADGTTFIRAARRPAGDSGWSRMTPFFVAGPNASPGDWSPDGRWVAYAQGGRLYRADRDGKNARAIATIPADLAPFWTRWSQDGRLVYYSGLKLDGKYLIYAVPSQGGVAREVVHSEGPSYQSFRFSFLVHDNTLYTSLVDRQSDIWLAEVVPK